MKTLIFGFFTFLSLCSNPLFAQVADKAENIAPLLIGEKIPSANVLDAQGKSYDLSILLGQKPTVLVFYRGSWCPYCNKQLAGLAEKDQAIIDLGYQIIAISPDKYQELQALGEKNKVNYSLYSDPNANLITEMGIAFGKKEDRFGILPVPTLMIVNTAGEILFEHINPNFRSRIEPELIIAVLKNLKL